MSRKTPLPDDTRVLLALAADYMHVFQYDIENDVTSLVLESKREEMIASMEDKSFREAFSIYIDNYVFPDDREMMKQQFSLPLVMLHVTKNNSYSIEYRNQEDRYCECKMALVWNMTGILTVGFADVDYQVRARKELLIEQKRRLDAMNTVSSEYASVAFVDFAEEKITFYSISDLFNEDFRNLMKKSISFTKAIRLYALEYVADEDRSCFLEKLSSENIRNELSVRKSFDMVHRVSFAGGEKQYARILIVKADKSGSEQDGFAVAFDFDDERIRRSMGLSVPVLTTSDNMREIENNIERRG